MRSPESGVPESETLWCVNVQSVVNPWFVLTAGFVNPDTGMPRVLWLALVSLTLGASALHVRTQHSGRS